MDNEPVAWMDIRTSKCVVFINTPPSDDWIPLYTHPAKESKAKDRFSNYESICLQCGTTIYKPAFKTLTDAEIRTIQDMCHLKNVGYNTFIMRFARAILKRASEK